MPEETIDCSDAKKCVLCKRPIQGYDSRFNCLMIDDIIEADLCQACIDKFLRWQQKVFACLFPTGAAKRIQSRR